MGDTLGTMLAQTTHISLLARLGKADGCPERAAAWIEFQSRYRGLICRYAVRRGLQSADCDDVLQETMIAIGKAMPDFRYDPERGKFRSYLKTVTSRIVSQKMRQNMRQDPLSLAGATDRAGSGEPDPEQEIVWETEWRRYHLQRAMRVIEAEFNEADRSAFVQYALEGRDARETAEFLGMSLDRVYQAKSRILRRLGAVIEAQVAEEG